MSGNFHPRRGPEWAITQRIYDAFECNTGLEIKPSYVIRRNADGDLDYFGAPLRSDVWQNGDAIATLKFFHPEEELSDADADEVLQVFSHEADALAQEAHASILMGAVTGIAIRSMRKQGEVWADGGFQAKTDTAANDEEKNAVLRSFEPIADEIRQKDAALARKASSDFMEASVTVTRYPLLYANKAAMALDIEVDDSLEITVSNVQSSINTNSYGKVMTISIFDSNLNEVKRTYEVRTINAGDENTMVLDKVQYHPGFQPDLNGLSSEVFAVLGPDYTQEAVELTLMIHNYMSALALLKRSSEIIDLTDKKEPKHGDIMVQEYLKELSQLQQQLDTFTYRFKDEPLYEALQKAVQNAKANAKVFVEENSILRLMDMQSREATPEEAEAIIAFLEN